MKCSECTACRYVTYNNHTHNGEWKCYGVKEPFTIEDIEQECTEYPEMRKTNTMVEEDYSSVYLTPEEKAAVTSIKDSGSTTEFDTGAHRDARENKGRCDLLPLEVVSRYIDDESFDPVLEHIRDFQKTNSTSHLYNALAYFDEKCWDNCYTMMLEVAKHYEEGANKYGADNWKKGMPVHIYIDSAIRHYLKWLRGDKDENHDRAFVWNLMCCIWEVDYHTEDRKSDGV